MGTGGNGQVARCQIEVLVAESMVFTAKDDRAVGCGAGVLAIWGGEPGEDLAGGTEGAIAISSEGCGNPLAACEGAEEASVGLCGFKDFGGMDGHVAGFVTEGIAFGVDEVELGEAHVFHDAGDRADVAGSGGFDQDDAGLGEVGGQRDRGDSGLDLGSHNQ